MNIKGLEAESGAAPAITAEAARMRHRSVTDPPTGFHSFTNPGGNHGQGPKKKQPRTEETQGGEAQARYRDHFDFEGEARQRLEGKEVARLWHCRR